MNTPTGGAPVIIRAGGFFLLMAAALWAQNFGEIQGTVSDQSGAVIAGAKVTVTHEATGVARSLETNAAGAYAAPFLQPGVYGISVQMEGFKSASLDQPVVLEVGDVHQANLQLEIGAVTEAVEVVAGAQMLQTQSTAVGTVIDNQRIVDLPVNGRTFTDLVKLAPNVTAEMSGGSQANNRQGGDRSRQAISVAGQRQQFNRFTLDGVENTDVNFNSFVIRPSIDALQEFKVQSGIYSAQYGRATSQISAATKSGTNAFHGAVFEFHRNDNLDAAEWDVQGGKNPFVRNQYGATISGPILRDRLFFLASYEGLRDRKTFEERSSVATDRMREGDFGGFAEIYDPASRVYETGANGSERAVSADRFANDIIPQSRLSSPALQLLEFYPRATRPGDDIVRNYRRDVSRPDDWDQFLTRIDWRENNGSNWFGRYAAGDDFETTANAFPFNQNRRESRVYQAMLSNTRVLGPTVVNELRLGYNRFKNDVIPFFANERNVGAELDIVGLPDTVPAAWGSPGISFNDGVSGFGTGGNPWVNRNRTFQVLDNLSWIAGKHSWKFGGEYRRDNYNHLGAQFLTASYGHRGWATWDPSSDARRNQTGTGFADFLVGESSQFRRALEPADVRFRASSYSVYAEDAWKVRPDLTLTLGLRYEFTPSWRPSHRGIMNVQMFDPGVGPGGFLEGRRTPVMTRPGAGDFYEGLDFRFTDQLPTQAGDGPMGPRLIRNDRNDFAPRFGIAYSPGARWTIRTGVGLFYTQDTSNPRFDMGRNLSGDTSLNSSQERPTVPLADPLRFASQSFECADWDGVCIGLPFVLANAENRKTPYVAQWMFNFQRQLTRSLALEAGYQGSAGSRLERLRAYNHEVEPWGPDDPRTASIDLLRPWGDIYNRIQYVDGSVNSSYNAASLKLRQRFDSGLNYLIGYTWSKAIDDGGGIRTNFGDNLFPNNSYNLAAERGLSQFHTAHRLVSSFLYEIPFGPGKAAFQRGLASKLLGGWQVGSIITFSSGTPTFPAGGRFSQRPDATGVSPTIDNPTADRFWNVEAFEANNFYSVGNAGRGTLLNPGYGQWDFSLLKNIALFEGHRLQFRFEAFNFTNHPNWNRPPTNVRNRNFGVVTSARTMRELQFGLKYVF